MAAAPFLGRLFYFGEMITARIRIAVLGMMVWASLATLAHGQSAFRKFGKLTWPEKCWTAGHPFAALKVWKVSRDALAQTDSLFRTQTLAGPLNGGPVDAFRHAYWVSGLCQAIGPRKALGLARAHERGNYRNFLHGQQEEEYIPDRVCSEMDWWNNSRGMEIWASKPEATPKERLILVLQYYQEGMLKVIAQNGSGQFVGQNDEALPRDAWEGLWLNGRKLRNSRAEDLP